MGVQQAGGLLEGDAVLEAGVEQIAQRGGQADGAAAGPRTRGRREAARWKRSRSRRERQPGLGLEGLARVIDRACRVQVGGRGGAAAGRTNQGGRSHAPASPRNQRPAGKIPGARGGRGRVCGRLPRHRTAVVGDPGGTRTTVAAGDAVAVGGRARSRRTRRSRSSGPGVVDVRRVGVIGEAGVEDLGDAGDGGVPGGDPVAGRDARAGRGRRGRSGRVARSFRASETYKTGGGRGGKAEGRIRQRAPGKAVHVALRVRPERRGPFRRGAGARQHRRELELFRDLCSRRRSPSSSVRGSSPTARESWHGRRDRRVSGIAAGPPSLRDGGRDDVVLGPGELFVVPRGVEHCPKGGRGDRDHAAGAGRGLNTGDAGGPLTRPAATLE